MENLEILKNIKDYMQWCIDRGYHKFTYNDLGWDFKCIDAINLIDDVLTHITKQEKMIELIEKECRQRLAFAKRIRRSEKRNPDDFNQGLEFESATIMNLLSGEPHWEYEGKYFDDIDKQVEKLKLEESE